MAKEIHRSLLAVCFMIAALSAGCLSVYKTDVQQGNVVTPEVLERLRLGMNRGQVRFVLGTPLVADPFHNNRWDYFYLLKKGGAADVQTQRVTVLFRDEQLVAVEGDIAVNLNETASPVADDAQSGSVPDSVAPGVNDATAGPGVTPRFEAL